MGTNYYLPPDCGGTCYHCTDTGLHIGKRSAGWTFGFQAHPDEGLTSWKAWQERITTVGVVIDEYGERFSPTEFTALVEATRQPLGPNGIEPIRRYDRRIRIDGDSRSTRDADGWDFWDGDFS